MLYYFIPSRYVCFHLSRLDRWRTTKLPKLWSCKLSENKPGQKWRNQEMGDHALSIYPCSVELHQSPHKWGRGLLSQQIPKFTRCCRRTRSLMSRLDSRLHSGCFRRFSRRVQIQVLWATLNLFLWSSNVTGIHFLPCFAGDSDRPSGFRSVKAPSTKIGSSVGNAQKLPVCDKCGSGIV